MVCEYCQQRQLPKPKTYEIREEEEGDEEQENEPTNMATPDQVLTLIRSKIKLAAYYDSNITLLQYVGQKIDSNKKNILLFLNKAHFYIIATCNNKAWISDEVDNIHSRPALERKLKKCLGVEKITKLVYNFQQYEDHCGSSAALIALECMRLLKGKQTGIDQTHLEPAINMRKQFIQRLHPNESKPDPALDENEKPLKLNRIQTRRCKVCNKYYPKRQTLLQHERTCTNLQNKQ